MKKTLILAALAAMSLGCSANDGWRDDAESITVDMGSLHAYIRSSNYLDGMIYYREWADGSTFSLEVRALGLSERYVNCAYVIAYKGEK